MAHTPREARDRYLPLDRNAHKGVFLHPARRRARGDDAPGREVLCVWHHLDISRDIERARAGETPKNGLGSKISENRIFRPKTSPLHVFGDPSHDPLGRTKKASEDKKTKTVYLCRKVPSRCSYEKRLPWDCFRETPITLPLFKVVKVVINSPHSPARLQDD
jgi:hypothetical protein